MSLFERVERRSALLARLFRFATVGLTSTLLYAVIALGLQSVSVPPVPASLVAFAAGSMLSFAGHKWFTFTSSGPALTEGSRFALTTALGFTLAAIIPAAFQAAGAPGWSAVMTSCIVIPAMNYVLLTTFVFARR